MPKCLCGLTMFFMANSKKYAFYGCLCGRIQVREESSQIELWYSPSSVTVVCAAWKGCFQELRVYASREKAKEEHARIRKDFDIEGVEASEALSFCEMIDCGIIH